MILDHFTLSILLKESKQELPIQFGQSLLVSTMASARLDACSLKLELSILHSVDDDRDDDANECKGLIHVDGKGLIYGRPAAFA